MSDIAYRYNPDKNLDGAFITGIPLADLTHAEVEALPEYLQQTIAACAFYEAVPTRGRKKSDDTATQEA
jgi:hypothetical protein